MYDQDVFIGPRFVEIQKDVGILETGKIQSHSFICELVTIGSDCSLLAWVMFINDLFSEGGPAAGDKTKWEKTNIGNKVYWFQCKPSLPVSICDHAVIIGAGAVVTKKISRRAYTQVTRRNFIDYFLNLFIDFMQIPFVDLHIQYHQENKKASTARHCKMLSAIRLYRRKNMCSELLLPKCMGAKACDRL